MSNLIFADNDILLKLAEYDLLDKACTALSVQPMDIRLQPASRYVVLRMLDKITEGKPSPYSIAGLARAIGFIERAGTVHSATDIDWIQNAEGVDIGEAQLASWALEAGDDSLLITGDKRFMKAIAVLPSAKHIFEGLRGRVVCLEEILRAIMLTHGVDCVRNAVQAAPECDKGMCLVFGSRFDLPDSQVWEGIESLLGNIAEVVGDGWLSRLARIIHEKHE